MGAQEFSNLVPGDTVREAFSKGVDQAAWEHGHGGYTGSLAEKHSYVVINPGKVYSKEDAFELSDKLLEDDDDRVNDKWGPAGALEVEGGQWLFFGWASS